MAPKFNKGQKVIIKPVSNQQLSPRDTDIEQYTGQIGEVTDYYWVSLSQGTNVVYLYTVRIGADQKEIALHEDELEMCPV